MISMQKGILPREVTETLRACCECARSMSMSEARVSRA